MLRICTVTIHCMNKCSTSFPISHVVSSLESIQCRTFNFLGYSSYNCSYRRKKIVSMDDNCYTNYYSNHCISKGQILYSDAEHKFVIQHCKSEHNFVIQHNSEHAQICNPTLLYFRAQISNPTLLYFRAQIHNCTSEY